MAVYNYDPNLNSYYGGYYSSPYNNLNISMPSTLNGKLVENVDVAKVAEVPVGNYGVFPKADLTEIYIKTWNPNGTTNLLTYKLTDGTPKMSQNDLMQINEKLASLEAKIDTLL